MHIRKMMLTWGKVVVTWTTLPMGRILLRSRTSTSQVTPRLRCICQERFTRGQICHKSGGREIGLVVVKF